MVSPISQTAAIPVAAEVANKSSGNTARARSGGLASGVVEKNSMRPDDAVQTPENINEGKENTHEASFAGEEGEVRKSEVKDGEMRTKVYDRKGKLLRVIPPGYIPVGEKRFNLTV